MIEHLKETINDTKLYDFTLKDGKLSHIKIYNPDGYVINETDLIDAKISSYKVYKSCTDDNQKDYCRDRIAIPRLSYEITLGYSEILSNYKLYDLETQKLTYEGECFNAEKSGVGAEYDTDGVMRYKGAYLKDQRHGFGTSYHSDGTPKYCGNYLKDRRNGKGTVYFPNGNRQYEGTWKNDKLFGECKMFYEDGSLQAEGNFNDRKLTGKFYVNDLTIYHGETRFNNRKKVYQPHGIGDSYYENGSISYSGDYKYGKASGKGTLYHDNGHIKYKGWFLDTHFHGFGEKYDYCAKLMSKGQWNKGKLEQINLTDEHIEKGYQIIEDQTFFYIGEVKNNKLEGYTETYNKRGFKFFEGFCKNHDANGICKKFHTFEFDHSFLQTIGYESDDKWNSFRMNYYKNGKLRDRLFYRNYDKIPNKFMVQYNKNGTINFAESYKGQFYSIKDYEKQYPK